MNNNHKYQHSKSPSRNISSLFKIKSLLIFLYLLRYSLLFSLILVLFLQNSSQAVWISKNDFMQQYSTKFVNDFPDDNLSRRTVMKHRCDSVTDPSIPKNLITPWTSKKDSIEWFVYASWIYTSPRQSVLAYLICAPFLDGIKIKDRFDKQLITYVPSINEATYTKILTKEWLKWCPIITQSNNLNDCNLMDVTNKIVATTLNDLTNIRHSASRWYMGISKKNDTKDAWYFISQRFTLAPWEKTEDRIKSLNAGLCNTAETPYFGEKQSERCGFPTTYALIVNNAKIGQEIIKKTIILDGEKLLQYECGNPDNGGDLLWCGINNHLNTQSYNNMIYNELWFYNQFLAMYESTASLSSAFLVGNQIGLGKEWQDQLLNQIRLQSQYQSSLITNAAQVSINLISQFEAAYPLHIWFLTASEKTASAVQYYFKPQQDNIKFWMIDRLNTQIKDTTAKGTTTQS